MDDSTRDHLRRLELMLLDSAVRNRPAEVASLLAEDFVEFGSSGRVFDKRQIIDAIGGDTGVHRSVADLRVRELSQDVALVTYRVRTDDGRASLRCSIWQRTGDKWRMSFHQGTPTAAADAG
jgi:hypothetical protein